MKLKIILFLMLASVSMAANQTQLTLLTPTDPANLMVTRTNDENLRITADAIYDNAGIPLHTNLNVYSNNIKNINSLIGTGSGIVTGFSEMFVGTQRVSSIVVGTGSVASADVANWNSNFVWYLSSSGRLANSDNMATKTNLANYTADGKLNMGGYTITNARDVTVTNSIQYRQLVPIDGANWIISATYFGYYSTDCIFGMAAGAGDRQYLWKGLYAGGDPWMSLTNTTSGGLLTIGNIIATNSVNLTNASVTVADATAEQNPVPLAQLNELLSDFSQKTLYGVTNAHPFIAGAGSLWSTNISGSAWTNIQTHAAASTNFAGTFWNTNCYDTVRAGNYIGRFFAVAAGGGTKYAYIELVYSDDNGTTTNVIDTSAQVPIGTTLTSYRLTVDNPTEIPAPTALTNICLGISYYTVRTGVGASGSVTTYGGEPYDAHLETPGLGSVSLGVRGATNVTMSSGFGGVYDSVNRVMALTNNSNLNMGGYGITNQSTLFDPSILTGVSNTITLGGSVNLYYWDLTNNSQITFAPCVSNKGSGARLDVNKSGFSLTLNATNCIANGLGSISICTNIAESGNYTYLIDQAVMGTNIYDRKIGVYQLR